MRKAYLISHPPTRRLHGAAERLEVCARITKTIDRRGRLILGKEYAGRMVIIDDTDLDRLVITPAVAVPEREAWLYWNPAALVSVRKGLEQAKSRQFAAGPDMALAATK